MELISDTIFGSGANLPGDADLTIQTDKDGFPYMKGSTFKGLFREQMQLYMDWTKEERRRAGTLTGEPSAASDTDLESQLLGNSGSDRDFPRKFGFHDFTISPAVKAAVLKEIGPHPEQVTDCMCSNRTFTAIGENGTARNGSLRIVKTIHKGLAFYSKIDCQKEDEQLVREILAQIKWVGLLRNRGFGMVSIREEQP